MSDDCILRVVADEARMDRRSADLPDDDRPTLAELQANEYCSGCCGRGCRECGR